MFKFNVRGVSFQLTEHQMLAIICMNMMGLPRLKSIALLRQCMHCGLLEAKEIAEFVIDNFNLAGGEVHYKNVSCNVSFIGKVSC